MSAKRRTLLFDVMGTLIYDPFFVEMPEFFGLSFEEMLAQKDRDAWLRFERNEISNEVFLAAFFADRRAFDHAAFERHVRDAYRWLPGMEDLLQSLKAAGHTLHAFSNYPVWYRWIEAKFELTRYMTWSFVSCETGLRKPDPAAYQRALDELGVAPGDAIFVDDRRKNCLGASELGIETIEFQDAIQLRETMVSRGLIQA